MGTRTENLLLNDARDLGWEGLRVDISTGHGHSSHDFGDLMIGAPIETANPTSLLNLRTASELYVVEEKYRASDSKKYLQPQQEKIDGMIEASEAIGAIPLLAGRWSTQIYDQVEATHYIKDIRKVERTPSGHINLKPETAVNEFKTTEEFFTISV